MLSSIVIGYGHSGRDFHVPAIRRLHQLRGVRRPIGIVDPAPARLPTDGDTLLGRSLADLRSRFLPDATVVHICTPPADHAAVFDECVAEGFQRIVIEKPLVTTRSELDRVRELVLRHRLDVAVVANWLSSRLTVALHDQVALRGATALEQVDIVCSKSRIARSLSNGSHRSAFDVEMPHVVALALDLFGPRLRLIDAYTTDLVIGGRRVRAMAAAGMKLVAPGGPVVYVLTDLQAPVRQRYVAMRWRDGTEVVGHFPCDSADVYSQTARDRTQRLRR